MALEWNWSLAFCRRKSAKLTFWSGDSDEARSKPPDLPPKGLPSRWCFSISSSSLLSMNLCKQGKHIRIFAKHRVFIIGQMVAALCPASCPFECKDTIWIRKVGSSENWSQLGISQSGDHQLALMQWLNRDNTILSRKYQPPPYYCLLRHVLINPVTCRFQDQSRSQNLQ